MKRKYHFSGKVLSAPIAIGALVILIIVAIYLAIYIRQTNQISNLLPTAPSVSNQPTSQAANSSSPNIATNSSDAASQTSSSSASDSINLSEDDLGDNWTWTWNKNNTYNFTYETPTDWVKDTLSQSDHITKITHPEDPMIYITIQSAATLASGMEGSTKLLSSTKEYNVIKWQIDYWKRDDDGKLIMIADYYKDNKEYMVQAWGYPTTKKVEVEEVVDHILSTFKFTE
ncbi:MAG: hypothetical protein ACD_83C00209G0002 [uncultured bacterium]|nr:MAG: hypothetical protein ACD_83C00209G0002 [uncultured bacterium]